MGGILTQLATWARRAWWQLALVLVAATATGAGLISYNRHLSRIRESREAEDRRSAVRDSTAAAQVQKAYVAKRRGDCYDIYVKERQRYNNAEEPEYKEDTDRCVIRYKSTRPDPSCRRVLARGAPDYDMESALGRLMWDRYINCETGTFTNEF